MKRMPRRRLAAACGCWVLILPFLLAARAEAAKAPTLKALYNRTPVKSGAKTVATLAKDTLVKARSKRGDWFGVRVKVGGKWLKGWVHKSHVEVLDAEAALEAEAQKAFESLQAKAEKLAEEGKFRDAIAVMDTFPPRFWNTDVQNQVREYTLTLEEEANKPEHLEPEAERAFAELKEKADKLVEEGKIEDAIATMQRFPAKYSETKFGEKAEAVVLELQRKLNAPMPEADQQAIVDLVREKKYDAAVARVEKVVQDGMEADNPHVLAAKVYIQNHRIAAGTPDQLGDHILAADPYISDPAFHGNLANLRKVVAPPGKEQLTFRMNFGLIAIDVPTQGQTITFGEHLAEHYHWSPYVRMACGRVLARAAFYEDGEGKPDLVDKAADRYRQAVTLDLFHSAVSLDATAELARLLLRAGRHDEAIAACNTALERFPDDFVVLTALGQAHHAAGHPDEAAAAWEKSLNTNPHQPELASALQKVKGTPVAALDPPEMKLPDLYKSVCGSCVCILSQRGSGSGFVIRPEGLVCTNFHVIAGGPPYRVQYKPDPNAKAITLENAELLVIDPRHDLAFLKVDARPHRFRPLSLGRAKKILPGEDTVVVGNPGGPAGKIFDHTITRGIVSNRDRVIEGDVHYIQTDAAVNPGNSGGPMFNMRGQVVGVVTLGTRVMQGVGLAVHIDYARDLLPQAWPAVPAWDAGGE